MFLMLMLESGFLASILCDCGLATELRKASSSTRLLIFHIGVGTTMYASMVWGRIWGWLIPCWHNLEPFDERAAWNIATRNNGLWWILTLAWTVVSAVAFSSVGIFIWVQTLNGCWRAWSSVRKEMKVRSVEDKETSDNKNENNDKRLSDSDSGVIII
jgi:hypothetical protein